MKRGRPVVPPHSHLSPDSGGRLDALAGLEAAVQAANAALRAAQQLVGAIGGSSAADHVFFCPIAPTANATGDIWFDTDDGYKSYRWDGSSWVDIQGVIAAAQQAAEDAEAAAASKVKVFVQASQPTATATGDLWFDSDDNYRPYSWSGSTWTSVRDGTIAAAQSTADGKNKVFVQASAPAASAIGDLWFDSDDSYKPYTWNGGAWVSVRDGTIANAQAAADAAATLAGLKSAVFRQASAPSNPTGGYDLRAGDVWWSSDTTTNCADTNCKGHTLSGGVPQVGSYPHRKMYWPHLWTGSFWVDAQGTQQIIAQEVVAGVVQSILNTSDVVQTSDYASTGSGANEVATRGAKMRSTATDSDTVPPVLIGPGGAKVSDELLDRAVIKSAGAIAKPTGSVLYYRGQSQGVPVLYEAGNGDRLEVWTGRADVVSSVGVWYQFRFTLKPKANTDNLDALRYLKVQMFKNDASSVSDAGYSDTFYVCFPDRLYKVPGTVTDSGNYAVVSVEHRINSTIRYNGGQYPFNGYLRVTAYNAFGYSATRDFDFTGLTNAGNGTAGSYTLGGQGGGGGGGDTCLDPDTMVLVAPGSTIRVGDLRPGALVYTLPDDDPSVLPDFHRVAWVRAGENERLLVETVDGRVVVCSINELLHADGVWKRADLLRQGQVLTGAPGGIVARTEHLGLGPVIQSAVPSARTFLALNGLWLHNTYKP